jgi:hypothetical protein
MRITHVIGLPSTIGLLKAPITMSKIEERLHLAQFRCEKFSTLSLLIPPAQQGSFNNHHPYTAPPPRSQTY